MCSVGWRNFFETDENPAFDEVPRLAEKGESVFLHGFGGAGRTHAAEQIARELKAMAAAYTHCAARNISVDRGALTALFAIARTSTLRGSGIIIIDDVSEVPLAL